MKKLTIPFAGSRRELVLTVKDVPLTHVCPVVHEKDFGRITITYKPASALLELHGLAELLRSFDATEITHEDLTAELHGLITDELRPESLSITTSWTTAGLVYEVTA